MTLPDSIELKKISDCEVELKIIVPQEKMRVFWDEAVKKLSQNVQIPGFRPGNAPPELAKDKINPEALFEETSKIAVQKTYPEAILNQKIEPISQPQITVLKISPSDEFVYKVNTAVIPEITLPDYKKIADKTLKKEKKIEVDPKEIEASLNWLLKSRAKYPVINKPAELGNVVDVDFKTELNGKKIDDASAKGHRFVLGKGKFMEGFEKTIEGMSAGEEKNFSVTAPADYYKEELRNKKIDFYVKLNSITEEKLPELNDEFAKSLGNFENLTALKQNIAEGALIEKQAAAEHQRRLEFLDEVLKKININLPKILVESKIDQMMNETKHRVEDFGMNFEEYLKSLNKTESNLKTDLEPEAKRQLSHDLILRKISQIENIKAEESEIKEETTKILSQFHQHEKEEPKINKDALYEYAKEIITKEKIFKFLEN